MKSIILLLLSCIPWSGESIYSLELTCANGQPFSLESCRGKRILVVNIASASVHANQMNDLQQLYQAQADSLIILAVPTNDFDHEPLSDSLLSTYYQQQYGCSFVITQRMHTKGGSMHPLYRWLTQESRNGSASFEVGSDFQKYLINKEGELIGVFGGSVLPNSQEFLNAFNY